MYGVFADFYDRLTAEIDYRARAGYFDALIREQIQVEKDTILLDLACGTGALSAEFAKLGYDVIGVDGSPDMLAKATQRAGSGPLYLCQQMEELDLYGTVDAAVCALDSLNHVTESARLQRILDRVALFLAPGGVFVFDVNTPYKHREVLGQNTFVYDLDDLYCVWQNETDEALCTEITLDFFVRRGKTYTREGERFFERAWPHEQLLGMLDRAGFLFCGVREGDTAETVGECTERAVYTALRRHD